MKPKSIALLATIAVSLSSASAGTTYWDGGTTDIPTSGNGTSGGGAGNWDSTLITWDSGYGQSHVAWNNAGTDTAIFGGNGGTVTQTSAITVNRMVFETGANYTMLDAVGNTLTFAGSSPAIEAKSTVGWGISTPTTASKTVFAGSSGLTITGSGVTSAATSNAVVLVSANPHTLTGGFILKNGVTLNPNVRGYTGTTDFFPASNSLTFDGGHFLLSGFAGKTIDQTLGNATFNTLGSGSRLFITTSGSSASTTTKVHLGTISGNNLTAAGAGGLLTGLGSLPTAGTTHAITTTTAPTVAANSTYGRRLIYTGDGGANTGDWTTASDLGGGVYQLAPFSAYTNLTDDGADDNVDTVAFGNIALTLDQAHGTLKMTSGANLDLGSQILTLKSGGLLTTGATTNSGATVITSTQGITCLTAGSASNYELVIHPYNSAAASATNNPSYPTATGTTIAAVIGDNPNGTLGDLSDDLPVSVTINNLNSNPLTLSGQNLFTGTTTINGNSSVGDGKSSVIGFFNANKQTVPSEENPEPSPVTSPFGANDSVTLNGAVIQITGTGSGSSNRDIVVTGNSGFYVKGNYTQTLAGIISGTGTFSTDGDFASGGNGGTGNLVLAGANTFSGDIVFRLDSRITLAHADALKFATLDMTGLRILADLKTNNLAYNIGGLRGNTSVEIGTGGTAKTVTIGGNNQSNTYAGILSGDSGLTKSGTGTQTLLNANTYGSVSTGSTVVASGTLKLGVVGSSVINGTGSISANQNKLITALSGTAGLAVGQAVSGGNVGAGAVITSIDSPTQVTVSAINTAAFSAVPITFGAINGSVATPVIEVKSGATLDVSTQPSAYSLASTQTLGGAGTIAGAISISGKVSPGIGTLADATTLASDLNSSTATLTTGNVAFTATGEYVCTVDSANCDVLAAGNLTVDAAAKVSISGTPTAASYLIATYTGAEPTHFDESSLPSGYELDYTEAGKIKLVQAVGGSTPFENWASAPPYNLSGADALPGADPDKDGVTNIVEFALGGDPTNGSANGASLAKVQDVASSPALTLTILTRSGTSFGIGTTGPRTAIKDGITYTIEGGQNLSDWTGNIAEVSPAITAGMASAPSGYEYHTFKSAGPVASTAKDFIRAKVEGQ